MTLAAASWLPRAKTLKLHERCRVDHECGPGRTLILKHETDGYKAWCFRCNDRGWEPPAPVPLAVRVARLQEQRVADVKAMQAVDLPEPRLAWAEWPDAARLWLLKAGLSAHDAGQLGAYYHPGTGRVVLPVLVGGRAVFWQARGLAGAVPKYLAPMVDKKSIVPRYGQADAITLTEDILSAYKVGTVAEGWALMGTSINDGCLAAVIATGKPVNVWLDPDAAGIRAAKKVLAALRGAGVNARNIISKQDPKLMHRAQIKELLCIITK